MEKLEDKIYDAYYSEKDTLFRKKVRERIHWVCSHAKGKEILDIGCSQGITSIILGREGKTVLGIDLSETAIKEANKNLQKEQNITQECVTFEQGNFMIKDFSEEYDSIILGEVLEHITDIEAFFNKAVSLVKNNGRIIITTPFGINDFPDHKRTFYIKDFLELQNQEVCITNVEFFGKWIGVIYEKKSNQEPLALESNLLETFENSLYDLERSHINNSNKLKKQINQLKSDLESKKSADDIEKSNNKESLYQQEKLQKAQLQKELIEQYQKEESLINDYKQLMKKYEALERKYNNLKNSKLGKITMKYWGIRRGKRRK